MAINQLSTSNTFTQWLTATSSLIGVANSLTDNSGGGLIVNSSVFIEGSSASLNVRTQANINTLRANTANIGNTSFSESNVRIQTDLTVGRNLSATTVYANTIFANGLNLLDVALQIVPAFDRSNAAFAQSNVALTQANAAFLRANNSLNANVGGTISGNLVISGSNLVVSNGATELFNVRSWGVGLPSTSNSTGTVTVLGGIGVRGNVYADGIFDNGLRVIVQANAAFAQANVALTQANAAFAQANVALTQANAAFLRANNSLNANVGGTISGNLVISGSNLVVSNGATELFNVRSWGLGLPATSNDTGTITVTGGVGIKGNVYSDGVFDNGLRVIVQANAAFAQANITFVQANAAFAQANVAFAQSNIALTQANAAFIRANNSLNSNVGGTISGNLVISGSNIAVSNAGTELFNVRSWGLGLPATSNDTGTVTITGGVGVKGNVYSDGVYDNGFRIIIQANAAFAQANIALIQANAAFAQANVAFAQSNVALTQANAAFIRANNSLNANLGGTITANLVISGSNLAVSNAGTELFNVRSWNVGLPSTSNSTGTVTITGGVGVKGNVYSDGVYDNGFRIIIQANAAFAQANIALIQANAAFAQANVALIQANAAFIRANNSLNANVGGTITGNLVVSASNLVVSNAGTELFNVRSWGVGLPSTSNSTGTVTVLGGVGIRGNVYADGIFDNNIRVLVQANAAFAQANISLIQANAAFAQANISLTQANAAFAQANIALTQANAAFAQANAAFASTNSAFTQANAAFLRANNSLDANNGGIVTADVTIRSASGIRAEVAATQDAVVLRGRSGGTGSYAVTLTPETLTASRTVTIPNEDFTLGFRNVPSVGSDKTTNYTLATTDVGKHVKVGTGGSITIPDATFADGDVVTLFNNTSSDVLITCSITTAYIAAFDSDVATMSLSTRGIATIIFTSSTSCIVVGNVI